MRRRQLVHAVMETRSFPLGVLLVTLAVTAPLHVGGATEFYVHPDLTGSVQNGSAAGAGADGCCICAYLGCPVWACGTHRPGRAARLGKLARSVRVAEPEPVVVGPSWHGTRSTIQ
jgi:hypothetical protein